ncbi:MAG: hypothetical protein N2050_02250 [Flavobacteriales bacterium]|nr:hypothetical protein [Flavobacteriales bacterium]
MMSGVASLAAGMLLTSLSLRPPEKLSELGLFVPPLKNLQPSEGVVPYDLTVALFSDYAFKKRFVRLPAGQSARFDPEEIFDFPEGTLLIKNFYYPEDFRTPDGARRILETRILARTARGWEAWPYVWNAEQTEAYYDVAGLSTSVSWIHYDGRKRQIAYVVPNKNQCKQCHEYKGAISPIGPAARHLNRMYSYPGAGVKNQLMYWAEQGLLRELPPLEQVGADPEMHNPDADINSRARAYLDINCGHCHRPEGQAATSGLFLNYREKDPVKLGIRKPPVAAGRAAAHLQYSIEPGAPEKSILIYRMASLDPGIMMPEMGRRTVDEEGIALLREWISEMKP